MGRPDATGAGDGPAPRSREGFPPQLAFAPLGTNVYIDGFNFYYGCVKSTPYKWLDFTVLAAELLRGHHINRVKYFTARVKDRPPDIGQSQRQDTYLRALAARGVEVYFGTFQTRMKVVRLARGRRGRRHFAKAWVTEEKGTDVSLGAHLLWDAFHGAMNCALVLSNDADLQVPVTMAVEFGISVVVVNPHHHAGQKHHLEGSDRRNLRKAHLQRSQLPREMHDLAGRIIVRPPAWDP